jgi:hypothetical protein
MWFLGGSRGSCTVMQFWSDSFAFPDSSNTAGGAAAAADDDDGEEDLYR